MINGNTTGIRKSILDVLESLYDLDLTGEMFAPAELLEVLAQITCAIGREISVYLSRSGAVLDISIGDGATVELRSIRLRRNDRRLSKVRCIHTHPGGNPELSDVDISSLRTMRFDAMAAVGAQEGRATGIQAAFLGAEVRGMLSVERTPILPVKRIPQLDWMHRIEEADAQVANGSKGCEVREEAERVVLLGLGNEHSMQELKALAEAAGARVVGSMVQSRAKPEPGTYIGSGKAEELSLLCQAAEADTLITDDELTGVQVRNLENFMRGVKVIDRTELILDIFAQRAKTREGKLQVEMAQMAYQLPRLTGKGQSMSRLGGGIGTRGPGESQLEMDRRRIRRRITELRREIASLESQRELRRSKREKKGIPVVALVGYTNAGKTTLLNTLSGADAFAENMLFATLDPLMRTVRTSSGCEFILSDTVGFVSKLPHDLVDAFKSTLEEVISADVLVLVQDGTSPVMQQEKQVVLDVLQSLGVVDKPRIDVVNKADLPLTDCGSGELLISARTGEGTDALMKRIEQEISRDSLLVQLVIPYDRGELVNRLHLQAGVLEEAYEADGVHMLVRTQRKQMDMMGIGAFEVNIPIRTAQQSDGGVPDPSDQQKGDSDR